MLEVRLWQGCSLDRHYNSLLCALAAKAILLCKDDTRKEYNEYI